MKKMRKGKAVGNDKVAFELIESLGDFGLDKITEIANYVYDSEDSPEEVHESIFNALPKKLGTIDCKTHATVSLMSHVTKIVSRVMLNRNKSTIWEGVTNEQFGYKTGKRTRNAILSLIIKNPSKSKSICYIDFIKAFDCVKHGKLM